MGEVRVTRNGTKTKYIAGIRYIFSKRLDKWIPSKFQNRNRNLKIEMGL